MARVTRMTKRRLGELLRAEALITEEQVARALEEQRARNLFFGEALVGLGFITEDKIAETIARQFGLPFMSARQYRIKTEVLDIFPERMLREYQFIPLDFLGDRLVIICAGMTSRDVLDELERLAERRVCQYIGTWSDIRSALDTLFKGRAKTETTKSVGATESRKAASAAKPAVVEEATPPPAAEPSEPGEIELIPAPDELNELGKLLLNDTATFEEQPKQTADSSPAATLGPAAASGSAGRVSAFAGPVGATRVSAFRSNLGASEAGAASGHSESASSVQKAEKEKGGVKSPPPKQKTG